MELGEIEAAVRGLEGVNDVVVIADQLNGATRLVADIANASLDAKPSRLSESLRNTLPDHMIPHEWFLLERLLHNV